MPISLLRSLLLYTDPDVISKEMRAVIEEDTRVAEKLAVDVKAFKANIEEAVFTSPLFRRDVYVWFILLNMLRDDAYLDKLMRHEPPERRQRFIAECTRLCYILATCGIVDCGRLLLSSASSHPASLFTPSIIVEYLTMVYAQL